MLWYNVDNCLIFADDIVPYIFRCWVDFHKFTLYFYIIEAKCNESGKQILVNFVFSVPVDPSPIKFKYPPGLVVVEEFITPEEEAMLMNLIDWGDAPISTAEGMFKGEIFVALLRIPYTVVQAT